MILTIRLAHRVLARARVYDAKHGAAVLRSVAARVGVSHLSLDWSIA